MSQTQASSTPTTPAPATAPTTFRFRETTAAAMGGTVTEPGLVKGCKILGLVSANGRRYLGEAVKKAIGLYEGRFVYVDHALAGNSPLAQSEQPRKFLDKFGRYRNVREATDGGLIGDLHYNTEHPAAKTFEGWLKSDPSAVGFSHVATGKVRKGADGVHEVYELLTVESVDLVADPATTKGIYEAMMPMGDGAGLDMVAGMMPGCDGYEAHVGKIVSAVMCDPNLDKAAKAKKLMAALELVDTSEEKKDMDMSQTKPEKKPGEKPDDKPKPGEPEKKKPEEGPMDDEKAEEWLKARAASDAHAAHIARRLDEQKVKTRLAEQRDKARRKCVESKLPPALVTDVFLDTLASAADDRAMEALIADRKALTSARPLSLPASGNEPSLDDFIKAVG